MKKVVAVLLIVSLMLSVSACGSVSTATLSKERVYKLKLSTVLNETSPIVVGFYEWSKRVKEKTNGKVIVEIYPSGQFGADEDVIEQAILGANVAISTDGGRMATYVNDLGIIGMPYIADNYDEAMQITQTKQFNELEELLAKQDDLRILSFNWYDGDRHFLTNKPIRVPDDLKGLRIRTPGAPVWTQSVSNMGGTPIAMTWGDAYNAMQSNSIEGVEAQHTASYGGRIYEVAKYINKTSHFQLVNAIVCSEEWFQKLPEEYRDILVTECEATAAENAKYVEQVQGEFEANMVKEGMEVVESDVAAFRAAAEKTYDDLDFRELRDEIYHEIGKSAE